MKRPLVLTLVLGLLCALGAGAPDANAKSKVSILCLNKKGTDYKYRVAPAKCAHYGPGGAFAGGVFLTNLQWTGFGAPTATATGIECGFHLPCANTPVTVTAFRIKKVCGHRVYTRLTSTSSFGATTVKLTRCAKHLG